MKGFCDGQWYQLDHMQTVCTSLQTDNHTNTSSLIFFRPNAQLCLSKCYMFQTVRTTFWTRHDASVAGDDGTTKSSTEDVVAETVVTSPHHGRHLEMTMLVQPSVANGSDGRNEQRPHPGGNGVSPECTSVIHIPLTYLFQNICVAWWCSGQGIKGPIQQQHATSAQRCAKTSVCREADFAPDLQPHVFQDPAKTGHHECSSSRLCAAAPVVASSSLEEVRIWLGQHLRFHPFVQGAQRK